MFLVAAGIHVALAQVGWFERYQAYLIALGVLVLLGIAYETAPSDAPPARPRIPRSCPGPAGPAALCHRGELAARVPRAVQDTYQQRYQAGRFLGRYYDGQPAATGELGSSASSTGARSPTSSASATTRCCRPERSSQQNPGKDYWTQLAKDRGFKVAAVYPSTSLFNTPDDWILVGTWHMDHNTAPPLSNRSSSPTPSEVRPLEAAGRERNPPRSVETVEYRADSSRSTSVSDPAPQSATRRAVTRPMVALEHLTVGRAPSPAGGTGTSHHAVTGACHRAWRSAGLTSSRGRGPCVLGQSASESLRRFTRSSWAVPPPTPEHAGDERRMRRWRPVSTKAPPGRGPDIVAPDPSGPIRRPVAGTEARLDAAAAAGRPVPARPPHALCPDDRRGHTVPDSTSRADRPGCCGRTTGCRSASRPTFGLSPSTWRQSS